MNQSVTHPRGLKNLIAIQMWEFFSYYGMRSLLILYLTQQLVMSDHKAYALYGAYTSLVYVTPIIGGYIADKYLGNFWSVIIGSLLMIVGHTVLSIPSNDHTTLYTALALIICGYGFFKTNSSCLLGELYKNNDNAREAGFSISYIGSNIGAAISPVLCGYAAVTWGWHIGFALAGLGMACGLCVFLTGRHHFVDVQKSNTKALKQRSFGTPHWVWLIIATVLSCAFLAYVLKVLWAGYILFAICVVSGIKVISLYKQSNREDRTKLNSILYFMCFGTVFWAFDQQGGSSISLFIERNVNTSFFGYDIPTAFFQSINPVAVIFGGLAVSWLWRVLAKKEISLRTLTKLNLGLILLTAGFSLITLSSQLAMNGDGHTTFTWILLGLFCIGVAELFIDPVALAAITRLNPRGATGTLAGIYMLASGSLANYLAANVAQLASTDTESNGHLNLVAAAAQYHNVFQSILFITFGVLFIGLAFDFYNKKSQKIALD